MPNQRVYRSSLILVLTWVQRFDQFLMVFSLGFQWVLAQTVNHGLQNIRKTFYHKLVFALIVCKCRLAFSKETRELNA